METKEIQLAFWKKLKMSDPDLFNGKPQGQHYFDIRIAGIPHMLIRLDIYLTKRDYEDKGVQTVSLVVDPDKNRELKRLFEKDCIRVKRDCVINRVYNALLDTPIDSDQEKWQPYIDWFIKYTKKIKALLESWES